MKMSDAVPRAQVNPCIDSTSPQSKLPWCDPKLPIDERVKDMVGRIPLKEKLPLLDTGGSPVPSHLALLPTCFTNTGTPAALHWRTMSRAQAMSKGRARWPRWSLSPPTITQSTRSAVPGGAP